MAKDAASGSEGDELVPVTDDSKDDSVAEATDVFLRHGNRLVLYSSRSRGPLSAAQWGRLLESRRQEIYVKKLSLAESLYRLSEEVTQALADTMTTPQEKCVSLYSTTAVAMSEVLKARPSAEGLQALMEFVASTTTFVANNPSAVVSLQQLMAHDYSTYAHSASVYIHSVALAAWMQAGDRATLRNLGLGAILHDIGKTMISTDVLLKPGPLSDEEWKQMKRHPELGLKLLREIGQVPVLAQTLTWQHHERNDGSGYPRGLTGASIDPLTHIVILADMYDAITKNRTYRPAHSVFDTLQLLKADTGKRISLDAYRALVLMLAAGAAES